MELLLKSIPDYECRMTNSPLSCRILVLLCAAIVAWTFVLSLGLKFLFGAGVTGGWLIAGIMCTVLFGGLILMMREIKESILTPCHVVKLRIEPSPLRSRLRAQATTVVELEEQLDRSYAAIRRQSLGLATSRGTNRRRSETRKPCVGTKPVLAA